MPELIVQNLCKSFGQVKAVDDVSFTVKDGEFLTLLGPSGCGKSTTLAAIAGLDRPDTGFIAVGDTVFFDSKHRTFIEPEERNCGLVFQSYALWPHMTVAQNLDFPLKLRKMPRHERQRRIDETLRLVELQDHHARYPHQLSGGQQQRVALARALVYSPSLLLLDEPLSNLDAKLRDRARYWLKHLQGTVGLTTVYVTHDQIEALALSDRIAVMQDGRIRQIGTPQEIYENPAEPFVAEFIGTSSFLNGYVGRLDAGPTVEVILDEARGHTAVFQTDRPFRVGDAVSVAVRPEKVRVLPADAKGGPADHNNLPGEVLEGSYMGARHQYTIAVGAMRVRAELDRPLNSTKVTVALPIDDCAVFRAD